MLILTRATPINGLPPLVSAIGSYHVFGLASPSLLLALAISIALAVFYRYAAAGKEILATGANPKAALMSGISVSGNVILSHVLSGVLAAVAGLMVVARVGAAMPAVGGEDWLLPSFLGPVLGGTSLSGGYVSVLGTVLGALLVTIIRSGLLVLDISNFWLQLFLGLFLLGAVLAQRFSGALLARLR
jgi:ribose transport system permease protein